MFDNVGRNLDEGAGKRTLASAAGTLVLGGVVIGVLALYTAYFAVSTAVDLLLDNEEMVEVEITDPELDEAPPPPPPPAPKTPEPEEEEEEEDEPESDEMDEEVEELDKEIEEKVANVKEEKPPPGRADGIVGGTGDPNVVSSVYGGGGRAVHHSDVRKKRTVDPRYPEAAKSMNLGDVSCKVRIFIDATGVPYNLKFEACPKVFHASAKDALMKWRFYPARDEKGKKMKAHFILKIKYRLTG